MYRRSIYFIVILSFSFTIFLLSAIFFVSTNSRIFSSKKNVFIANSAKEIVNILESLNLYGRTMVVFTSQGKLQPMDEKDFIKYSKFPIPAKDIYPQLKNKINDDNYLWLMLYKGLIRKLIWISPTKKVTKKMWVKITPLEGYPSSNMPEIKEKVLILVEPSFLKWKNPEEAINLIKNYDYDILILKNDSIVKKDDQLIKELQKRLLSL